MEVVMKIRSSLLKFTRVLALSLSVALFFSVANPVAISAASPKYLAVDYMKSMANLSWKPASNLTIWGSTYKAGTTYKGIPYSQSYITPYQTNSSISNATGFLNKMQYYSGAYRLSSSSTGNDCCDAVLMAWRSLGFSVGGTGVNDWYTGNLATTAIANRNNSSGFRLLGTQYFNLNGVSITDIYPSQSNVYNAYNLMQKGDIVVKDGHAMMVMSVDTAANLVRIIDQYGPKCTNGNCSFRTEYVYNYSTLYSERYIPITIS